MNYDLCIIGGAGHVGLPLGVAFANKGVKTVLLDINKAALGKIKAGVFPFMEENGSGELKAALKKKNLFVSQFPSVISQSRHIVLVIGTPVDEYLNPDFTGIIKTIDSYFSRFKDGHVLILRSTVYPGTSERIQRYFLERGKKVRVAFCPERILQGKAFEELRDLPQIVSAFDQKTYDEAAKLFQKLSDKKVVELKPKEAELAKLFANAWRYIKFAVGNQFFMIAEDHDLDYHKIYKATVQDYPRYQDLAPPGFAAGPCLLKDTMQLAAFNNNNFFLGHSAMLINEGLPSYLMKKMKRAFSDHPTAKNPNLKPFIGVAAESTLADLVKKLDHNHGLRSKTVGILGMAFKANSDDPRDSLSYKLRKIAQAECREVLCHDVYIKDPTFHPVETVLAKSDIVILATPHREYKSIDPKKYPNKRFVDVWNFWGRS